MQLRTCHKEGAPCLSVIMMQCRWWYPTSPPFGKMNKHLAKGLLYAYAKRTSDIGSWIATMMVLPSTFCMYWVSQGFRWWQVCGKADLYVAENAQDSSSGLLCAEAMQVHTLPLHLLLMLQQKAAHLHHISMQLLTCQYLLTVSADSAQTHRQGQSCA